MYQYLHNKHHICSQTVSSSNFNTITHYNGLETVPFINIYKINQESQALAKSAVPRNWALGLAPLAEDHHPFTIFQQIRSEHPNNQSPRWWNQWCSIDINI